MADANYGEIIAEIEAAKEKVRGPEELMHKVVSALARVVEVVHSSSAFWTEALGLARRAVNI